MQIIFLIALAIVSLFRAKIMENDNYCNIKQTNAVKGICIGLVFLSHSNGYLQFGNTIFDFLYSLPFRILGQLMVVMFLFYSGYGIAVQYQKKGDCYLQHFFYKRIVKTELHFFIGVFLFLILNTMLGIQNSLYDTVFSFIGWTTIGNSNWYIFDILLLYLVSLLSFSICKKSSLFIPLIWFFCLLIWIFLRITKGSDMWWYDTILVYPLGFTFAFYKSIVDKKLINNNCYYLSLALLIICFTFFYVIVNPITVSIKSMSFAILVVFITKRLFLGNRVLYWMGTHLFEIYLFQRIPMVILSNFDIHNPVVFIGASFLATIIISETTHKLYGAMDNRLDRLILRKHKRVLLES